MTIGVLFVCTAFPLTDGRGRVPQHGRPRRLDAAFTVNSAGTVGGHAGEPPALPAISRRLAHGYIANLRARSGRGASPVRPRAGHGSRLHLAQVRRWARSRLALRLLMFTSFCPRHQQLRRSLCGAARNMTRHSI